MATPLYLHSHNDSRDTTLSEVTHRLLAGVRGAVALTVANPQGRCYWRHLEGGSRVDGIDDRFENMGRRKIKRKDQGLI